MKIVLKKIIKLSFCFLLPLALFANKEYRIVIDKDNEEIKLPKDVKNIVNLWPSFTGSVIFLGAGDKITYPSKYIKPLVWAEFFSPGLKSRPVATNNIEELLKINPDLIIVVPKSGEAANFRRVNLPAINLEFNEDYETLKSSIKILGEALGNDFVQKAIDWGVELDKNIEDAKKAVGHLKEDEKPIIYYISAIFDDGFYRTSPKNSIQQKWVELAGGKYASKLLNLESSEVSAEAILSLNPDIIILGGSAQHEVKEKLLNDSAWKNIKAVKNAKVYTSPHGAWGWDKHGAETLLQIPYATNVVHPELYKVDMIKLTIDTYKKFTGISLTKKQAQNMLNGYGPNGEATRNMREKNK